MSCAHEDRQTPAAVLAGSVPWSDGFGRSPERGAARAPGAPEDRVAPEGSEQTWCRRTRSLAGAFDLIVERTFHRAYPIKSTSRLCCRRAMNSSSARVRPPSGPFTMTSAPGRSVWDPGKDWLPCVAPYTSFYTANVSVGNMTGAPGGIRTTASMRTVSVHLDTGSSVRKYHLHHSIQPRANRLERLPAFGQREGLADEPLGLKFLHDNARRSMRPADVPAPVKAGFRCSPGWK